MNIRIAGTLAATPGKLFAVTCHADDRARVVVGRADGAYGIAEQQECAHDIAGNHVAWRTTVPPDAAAQVECVRQAVGTHTAVLARWRFEREIWCWPRRDGEIRGDWVGQQLARPRAGEPDRGGEVRARRGQVIDIAVADDFHRPAASRRSCLLGVHAAISAPAGEADSN
jgi:hypothetical protein